MRAIIQQGFVREEVIDDIPAHELASARVLHYCTLHSKPIVYLTYHINQLICSFKIPHSSGVGTAICCAWWGSQEHNKFVRDLASEQSEIGLGEPRCIQCEGGL